MGSIALEASVPKYIGCQEASFYKYWDNIYKADRLQKLILAHELCEPYMIGKQAKEPSRQPRRQNPNKRETAKGAYLYSNLARGGKIKRIHDSHAYVESFMDDATDMTFISILKRKSNAPKATKNYIN